MPPTAEGLTFATSPSFAVTPGYWSGSVRGGAAGFCVISAIPLGVPGTLVGFTEVTPRLGRALLAGTHRQGHQQHHEQDRDRDHDHDHAGIDREHGNEGGAQNLRLLRPGVSVVFLVTSLRLGPTGWQVDHPELRSHRVPDPERTERQFWRRRRRSRTPYACAVGTRGDGGGITKSSEPRPPRRPVPWNRRGTTVDAGAQSAAGRRRRTTGTGARRTPNTSASWRKANAPVPGDDDPRHGTRNGYFYGCRCADCRAALAEYERRRRVRTRHHPMIR